MTATMFHVKIFYFKPAIDLIHNFSIFPFKSSESRVKRGKNISTASLSHKSDKSLPSRAENADTIIERLDKCILQ